MKVYDETIPLRPCPICGHDVHFNTPLPGPHFGVNRYLLCDYCKMQSGSTMEGKGWLLDAWNNRRIAVFPSKTWDPPKV